MKRKKKKSEITQNEEVCYHLLYFQFRKAVYFFYGRNVTLQGSQNEFAKQINCWRVATKKFFKFCICACLIYILISYSNVLQLKKYLNFYQFLLKTVATFHISFILK